MNSVKQPNCKLMQIFRPSASAILIFLGYVNGLPSFAENSNHSAAVRRFTACVNNAPKAQAARRVPLPAFGISMVIPYEFAVFEADEKKVIIENYLDIAHSKCKKVIESSGLKLTIKEISAIPGWDFDPGSLEIATEWSPESELGSTSERLFIFGENVPLYGSRGGREIIAKHPKTGKMLLMSGSLLDEKLILEFFQSARIE